MNTRPQAVADPPGLGAPTGQRYDTLIRLGASVLINHDALLMDDATITIGYDARIRLAPSYSPPYTRWMTANAAPTGSDVSPEMPHPNPDATSAAGQNLTAP